LLDKFQNILKTTPGNIKTIIHHQLHTAKDKNLMINEMRLQGIMAVVFIIF